MGLGGQAPCGCFRCSDCTCSSVRFGSRVWHPCVSRGLYSATPSSCSGAGTCRTMPRPDRCASCGTGPASRWFLSPLVALELPLTAVRLVEPLFLGGGPRVSPPVEHPPRAAARARVELRVRPVRAVAGDAARATQGPVGRPAGRGGHAHADPPALGGRDSFAARGGCGARSARPDQMGVRMLGRPRRGCPCFGCRPPLQERRASGIPPVMSGPTPPDGDRSGRRPASSAATATVSELPLARSEVAAWIVRRARGSTIPPRHC